MTTCHDCGDPIDESNHAVWEGHSYCFECYDSIELEEDEDDDLDEDSDFDEDEDLDEDPDFDDEGEYAHRRNGTDGRKRVFRAF